MGLRARDDGLRIVIDPKVWFELKQELDSYDKQLARNLRRRIKAAGEVAAAKVKDTLRLPSPGGGEDSGEGRAALIAATRVSVSFTAKSAGARIVTSSNRLPSEHKGLLSVYNKKTFRHPVYGNKENWVEQQGRPYFGAVISQMINREVLAEVMAAVDESLEELGKRRLESKGGL